MKRSDMIRRIVNTMDSYKGQTEMWNKPMKNDELANFILNTVEYNAMFPTHPWANPTSRLEWEPENET